MRIENPVPCWIKNYFTNSESLNEIKTLLRGLSLHTVCESARCPNISGCFKNNTATFLILGDKCTRNCKFCAINTRQLTGMEAKPDSVDWQEPFNVANAAEKLNLSYVVVTSVTRDDLEDGGSNLFSSVIEQIHNIGKRIEVLIPDFNGKRDAMRNVVDAVPEVINHNIETVPRLYDYIRPEADYSGSLSLLETVKELNPRIITKSGFMLGLGETEDEIIDLMKNLRNREVNILTIGQYLRPPRGKVKVAKYYTPEEFEQYESIGYEMGFDYVVSGPLVRSSYKAEEAYKRNVKLQNPNIK